MALATYGHVIEELEGTERRDARQRHSLSTLQVDAL